ncbi:Uncharacterised protein [Paucimonas lemoignei]|nr:Uncharacterised protein [Paucimonas lemoignei]
MPRFHRRHKMRVGRLSGGAVGWVARHGCRASAAGPWMARRRVPAPRCRSEGTAAKRGPYASAEVLVTFGTKSDPAVRTEPDSAAPGCSAGTQFKAHHSDSSKLRTYKERLQPRGAGTVDAYSPPVKLLSRLTRNATRPLLQKKGVPIQLVILRLLPTAVPSKTGVEPHRGISLCTASHFSNERAARLGNWPVGLSR